MFTKPVNDQQGYPNAFGRLVDIVEGPARRNFIRNGDFMVAQRGTSFAGITTAQYCLDGAYHQAAGTQTVTREAFTVGQTDVPGNPINHLRVQRTVAAGAANAIVQFPIEFPQRLSGKTVTFSFWAKVSSGTKALTVDWVFSGVTPGTYPSSLASITVTTTWTLYSVTATVEAMTAATSSAYIAPRIVESASLGTFTLDVADAQLEIGSEATYFERLGYLEQEQWCQRFFAKSFSRATAPAQNAGNGTGEMTFIAGKAAATAEASPRIFFPVRMRATPTTPTLYNPAAANAQVRDQTAAADCSSAAVANLTEQGFHVTATGNASTAVGNVLGVHYSATAEL